MNSTTATFLDKYGLRAAYLEGRSLRWRAGQAFFNALPADMQAILRGTLDDPFYKESEDAVLKAIAVLRSRGY